MKKLIGAILINKLIFYIRVSFIIDKLLGLIPTIEKQLTKAITKDKTIQFYINNLDKKNYKVITITHI